MLLYFKEDLQIYTNNFINLPSAKMSKSLKNLNEQKFCVAYLHRILETKKHLSKEETLTLVLEHYDLHALETSIMFHQPGSPFCFDECPELISYLEKELYCESRFPSYFLDIAVPIYARRMLTKLPVLEKKDLILTPMMDNTTDEPPKPPSQATITAPFLDFVKIPCTEKGEYLSFELTYLSYDE